MSKPVEKIEFIPRNTRGWPKTKQQLEWALAIVQKGMSAQGAALYVGYAKKTAAINTPRMSREMRPFLVFLQARKNAVAERQYDATTTRVLREITIIAFSNHADYVREVVIDGLPHLIGKPITDLSEEQQICVSSWKTELVATDDGDALDYKYVLYDKSQNLFALGKHLGMFNEKIMLELTHREAQAKRTNFSDLSTDKIMEIMETLKQFKDMAKNANSIPSTAIDVTEEVDQIGAIQ